MNEAEFFLHLEMRVCRELAGLPDPALKIWWCDGFLPDEFEIVGEQSRICGDAWVGIDGQDRWRFVLHLGKSSLRRDQVDWESVLPAEHVTGWLAMDFHTKLIKMSPQMAFLDRDVKEL